METQPYKKLYRSRKNRVLTGVAGGLAEYFNIDPIVMRLAFMLFGLMSAGAALLVYIIAAIIVPEEPLRSADIER